MLLEITNFGIEVMFCLLLYASCLHATCDFGCECSEAAQTVKCVSKDLREVPPAIPEYTRTLFITGNHITRIGPESFSGLRNITMLSLSNNRVAEVRSHSFSMMHSLHSLDLSKNQLVLIHLEAFVIPGSPLRMLNLSQALRSPSSGPDLGSTLRCGSLGRLLVLDLSRNGLTRLPPATFSLLSGLRRLLLAGNSLQGIENGTFLGLERLEELDLSRNAVRILGEESLRELQRLPSVRLLLGENPYTCTCGVGPLEAWLNASLDRVTDAPRLLCADPPELRNMSLIDAGKAAVGCTARGRSHLGLQTSYALLGVVLGLVGVVFLLVLYLNRNGIKRWACDTRDACRDVMEGYHYHFQVEPDPQVTQVSSSVQL